MGAPPYRPVPCSTQRSSSSESSPLQRNRTHVTRPGIRDAPDRIGKTCYDLAVMERRFHACTGPSREPGRRPKSLGTDIAPRISAPTLGLSTLAAASPTPARHLLVPVSISAKSSSQPVRTHALIDSGATHDFIHPDLVAQYAMARLNISSSSRLYRFE